MSLQLKHGVKLSIDEEGNWRLSTEVCIPPARVLARRTLRRMRLYAVQLQYLLWPFTSPSLLAAVIAIAIAVVVRAPPDSVLRSGTVATLVWRLSLLFPWLPGVPLAMRVAILTAWTVVLGLLTLAWLQRRVLQVLLLDKTWLHQARSPSLRVKIWASAVRLLTRGQPLMLTFQPSLPRLPVPSLQQTVAKFLSSARLLQDDAEYELTVSAAQRFLEGEGRKLQRYLVLKSFLAPNYVSDWWQQYIYLKSRTPLPINSNYYCLDSGRWLPTHVQEARAAVLIHNFCKFCEQIADETLQPIMLANGIVPLDMLQYVQMFATSRIPGREIDTLRHKDPWMVSYVAVVCKGTIYKLQVYKDGVLRAPDELEQLLAAIKRDAAARKPRVAEAQLPSLTALPRGEWAEVREQHFREGVNGRSLSVIESALFWVALDDRSYEMLDWSARGKALIAGNPAQPNVFFDKSLSLVVFNDGRAGLNAEHSYADAPAIAHLFETALIFGETTMDPYSADGHVKPFADIASASATAAAGSSSRLAATAGGVSAGVPGSTASNRVATASSSAVVEPWSRLTWALTAEIEEHVVTATAQLQRAVADLDLHVLSNTSVTKRFIKQCKVSPDGFLQAAMQLAFFRDQGHFSATYESCMTRLFKAGRTETVRPCTAESVSFVRTMEDAQASNQQKLAALRASCERHVQEYTAAMTGEGIDRHLFALYVVSVGTNTDSPFLKAAISVPWRLSTSQQPQQQTTLWDIRQPKWAHRISPGGGFGPVASDGYGVSYMVSGEDEVFFHISSLVSARPKADAGRFARTLFAALDEMKAVLSSALQETADLASANVPRPVADAAQEDGDGAAQAAAVSGPAGTPAAAPPAAHEQNLK